MNEINILIVCSSSRFSKSPPPLGLSHSPLNSVALHLSSFSCHSFWNYQRTSLFLSSSFCYLWGFFPFGALFSFTFFLLREENNSVFNCFLFSFICNCNSISWTLYWMDLAEEEHYSHHHLDFIEWNNLNPNWWVLACLTLPQQLCNYGGQTQGRNGAKGKWCVVIEEEFLRCQRDSSLWINLNFTSLWISSWLWQHWITWKD